jgi:hypothetical protein
MAKQTFTTGQVLTAAQMTSLQQTAMLGGAASAKTASYTLVAADAGTAISMSNAGATTITVNTALFAAGDTVHITNLGAGVCTITAGTATVNSSASLALAQYESGFLDFTSASAAIFVKGAGAAGGASGLTVVKATTSFSNVANTGTTFDNVFSATYNNYLIILDRVSAATSTDDLFFTYLYSGTEQATGYYGNMLRLKYDDTTTTSTVFSRNAATSLILNDMTGDAYYDTRASINVYTGNAIGMSGHCTAGGSNLGYATFGGFNETSRTYTGFRLKSSSSNITGSCTVYGLAKA